MNDGNSREQMFGQQQHGGGAPMQHHHQHHHHQARPHQQQHHHFQAPNQHQHHTAGHHHHHHHQVQHHQHNGSHHHHHHHGGHHHHHQHHNGGGSNAYLHQQGLNNVKPVGPAVNPIAGAGGNNNNQDAGNIGTGFNVNATPYVREERAEEDLFKDHTAGIDFSKYESIEVTVRPNDITPAETFAAMNLHSMLQNNVNRCSYVTPTPVQKNSIPIIVAGKDLMASAQTGSGKTAAFLLPAINYILQNCGRPQPDRVAYPNALIMCPTRELGVQTYEESRKFTYRTGLRCVVVYGGCDQRHQTNELQKGCNLIVATPGRLGDMFKRGVISYSKIRFMVLDEADRMLDMGFEPQIREIVEGRDSDMPPTGQRQTMMYSATFPKEIQNLARSFLSPDFYYLQVGRVGSTTDNITQKIMWVEDTQKTQNLVQILQDHADQSVLVFIEKKRECDYLERQLLQWGFPVCAIHGDRAQRDREAALNLFKTGQRRVLLATDVAARGLDIPNVHLVLQYDLPTNIDDYVHRIGRTGRAGKRGNAWCFFNEKNRNVNDDMYELLEESKQEMPSFLTQPRKRAHQALLAQHQATRYGGRGGYNNNRGGYGNRGGYNNNNNGGFQHRPHHHHHHHHHHHQSHSHHGAQPGGFGGHHHHQQAHHHHGGHHQAHQHHAHAHHHHNQQQQASLAPSPAQNQANVAAAGGNNNFSIPQPASRGRGQ